MSGAARGGVLTMASAARPDSPGDGTHQRIAAIGPRQVDFRVMSRDADADEAAVGIDRHLGAGIREIAGDGAGLVGVGQGHGKRQAAQGRIDADRGRRRVQLHGDDEGRALARLAQDLDAALHGLGEAAHDRQAEPGAAEAARGRAVGLHERLEQPVALLVGEADAGVGDLDAQHAVAGILERQPHRARLGELDGVAQQVEQDLLQAQRIADHAVGHVGGDIGDEAQALGHGLRCQRLGRALDQLDGRQLDLLEVEAAGLDLGEVQDVVDDACSSADAE